MSMATKAALIGLWRIDRHIADQRGPDARFTGRGEFCQCPDRLDTLIWIETGQLAIGVHPPIVATRTYRWVFGDMIEVRFEDGRPFHHFDPGLSIPKALHHCQPDIYRVAYHFGLPETWTVTWHVQGPRKDYAMASTMLRLHD